MNPLTLVKRIQNINSKEAALGISEEASWHAKYKESAYVFVGGIPYDLTEGDLLAVFSQYGEIVDVNLVRDKGTGKSKGFAFIAYEDQRSTNLAVDNLNGAQIVGRIIRVDHVSNYKKKEEEDEELEQQKREARGVCRAFQRGECTRGAGCKFSHDEQRAANTGWGAEDKQSRWGHEKFAGPITGAKRSSKRVPDPTVQREFNSGDKDAKGIERHYKRDEFRGRDEESRYVDKSSYLKTEMTVRFENKRSARHKTDLSRREDDDRSEEKRSRRHESELYPRQDRHRRGGEERSSQNRDSSSRHHRERER